MSLSTFIHMISNLDISAASCYIRSHSVQQSHPTRNLNVPVIGGRQPGRPGKRHGHSIPRIRHAARLYASGAVRTKQEAAEAVGVNPSYFNVVTQPGHARSNPEIIKIMDDIERAIQDKAVSLSSVIESVSREAVAEMRDLINHSQNEAIRLKAASDILDRNPETSKTQKHQLSGFSLGSEDAKALAAALVKSAEAQRLYGSQAMGDYVKIPQEGADAPGELNANGQSLTPEVRRLNEGVAERALERVLASAKAIELSDSGTASEGPASQDSASEGSRPVARASDEVIRERVAAITRPDDAKGMQL